MFQDIGLLKLQMIRGLDIAYISIIQFSFAIFMNIGLDKLFLPEREKIQDNTNIVQEFLLLCIMIALLVTFAYVGRKVIRQIPSPFHMMFGYRHDKMPELGDISAITGFMLLTSGYIESRISKIRNYFGLGTQFYDIEKEPKETGHATNK